MMSLDLSDRLGMKARMIIGVAISLIFFALLPPKISAQIKTDGTVGPAQSLNGPNYLIPQRLGTTSGQNLFHSFEKFGLIQNESATFTGADTIENVISRVTDGQVSSIDGLLRSEVGKADFFFINPAGVVFGPNAQVDVPGAFHVSTADELQFTDGNVFSATDPEKSTLTITEPASFGYLSPQPASIVLNGSKLGFAPTSRVSLSGGDVTIKAGSSLVSEGGEIQVTAVGESQLSMALDLEEFEIPTGGKIAVIESSVIDVSGFVGSNRVILRGGKIEMNDSVIAADNVGNENLDGKILLKAENISVIDSKVRAHVYGAGDGNDIIVDSGTLEINAATALDGRSYLLTRVLDNANGNAGDIIIKADQLSVLNGAQIISLLDEISIGNGGDIEVIVSGEIMIEGYNSSDRYSGIYSMTFSEFVAHGGTVRIEAPEIVISDGGRVQTITHGPGNAGPITIKAKELHLIKGDAILTGSYGEGDSGDIVITASGGILMESSGIYNWNQNTGKAGHTSLNANQIKLTNLSRIMANGYGIKNPGDIFIQANDIVSLYDRSKIEAGEIQINTRVLQMFSGGRIDTSTFDGEAGNITLSTNRLLIDGRGEATGVFSDTYSESGDGGNISIKVIEIGKLLNGGQISSTTKNDGNAGCIFLKATGLIIDGGEKEKNTLSGIYSETRDRLSSGDGGDINVKLSGHLKVLRGGQISTSTEAEGNAGRVSVEAKEIVIDGTDQNLKSGILSRSMDSPGNGGDVQIKATGLMKILNGGQVSASAGLGSGDAGEIRVDAGQLFIDGKGAGQSVIGEICISGQTGIFSEMGGALSDKGGNAGDINVKAKDNIEIYNGGQISANAKTGGADAGSIMIESAEIFISKKGSGIYSEVGFGSQGDAGKISIKTKNLIMTQTGVISTSTLSEGNAGKIIIHSRSLLIDGDNIDDQARISSLATEDAKGYVGNIEIEADRVELYNGGEISIEGAQNIVESKQEQTGEEYIFINSKCLLMNHGSRVNASSTGNLPAAAIKVQAKNLHVEDNSRITTFSANADGGPIKINGESLVLRDSIIITSAEGMDGDGGNIEVGGLTTNSANVIILDGGFVQANTTANDARGGDIFINAKAVIAENGLLEVGGLKGQVFKLGSSINVIQAAAPGGEQGNIAITAPNLDISGALINISAGFSEPAKMATDPCSAAAIKMPSSLVLCGHGGIAGGPDDPLDGPFERGWLELRK